MLCFQSVLYCIVLYNDVFTFLYVAVGNKLLLLLLLLCHMHQVSALTLYLLLHQASDLYINSTQKQMVQMIVLLALMHGWIVKKRILALASWNGTTANNTPVRFSSDFIFPSWSLILHPAGLAQVSWPLCHSMFDNSRLRKHVKFVKLLSYFLQKT